MGLKSVSEANQDKRDGRSKGPTSSSEAFQQGAPSTLGKLPSGSLGQKEAGALPKPPAQAEAGSLKALSLWEPGTTEKPKDQVPIAELALCET